MTDPAFRAKVRPKLHPAAQELVAAYESEPGGKTYPCLPEGIAAVLELLANQLHGPGGLYHKAALLRGEQP